MPRRRFLKGAAALGAGSVALPSARRARAVATESAAASKPKLERRNEQAGIVYRRLGRTNFRVSALSIGGLGLSPARLALFDAAARHGVNFVMAHAGAGTKALGEWFAKDKANRKKLFLGLQASPGGVDHHLKVMKTEVIDLVMMPVHNPKGVPREEIARSFEKARKEGKVRYLCLVFHSNLPAVWQAGIQAGFYDVLLPTYNFTTRKALQPLIAAAQRKDVGLLTMKAAGGLGKAGGKGAVSFASACKTFLADGVASVIKTMATAAELEKLLPVARSGGRVPPAKAASVNLTGQCTLCGACGDCPEQVAIQDILRTYQYYAGDLGWVDEAYRQYAAIPAGRLASACTDCGRCEAVCPEGLPIRRLIRDVHFELELELARRQGPACPGESR